MQFSVQILLARTRHLPTWSVDIPKRPYWRLYWNDREGASVATAAGRTPLDPDQIVLIAPRTDYTGSLRQPVEHLYLHFILDAPFDMVPPGIYSVAITGRHREELKEVRAVLGQEGRHKALVLTRLISAVCAELPNALWQDPVADPRFQSVVTAMEQHLRQPLSNAELAAGARMAPTAFVRRFTKLFGVSPQALYMEKRLEQALLMLEYADDSVDHVAEACGFCDRNYFSAVFKKKMGISPAAFRRQSREG